MIMNCNQCREKPNNVSEVKSSKARGCVEQLHMHMQYSDVRGDMIVTMDIEREGIFDLLVAGS